MTLVRTVVRELLQAGHSVRFRASGRSMWPLIRSEDLLHVEPADPARLRKGDVVLSLTARGLTAHRLTHIEGDAARFHTRGDHAPAGDDPFDRHELLGRVVATERAGVRWTLSSRSGLSLFIERVLVYTVLRTRSMFNREAGRRDLLSAIAEES